MPVLVTTAGITAGIAAGIATGIATEIAAALATAIAAAFAGGRGVTALGLLLTTLCLATRVAGRAVMMAGKTTKAPTTTTMAGLRLRFQTHKNDGECRQTKGHAH
jgi:hypothetical protein